MGNGTWWDIDRPLDYESSPASVVNTVESENVSVADEVDGSRRSAKMKEEATSKDIDRLETMPTTKASSHFLSSYVPDPSRSRVSGNV